MSGRRRVAVRVAATGVPAGLKALHVEQALIGADGKPQLRGPGPGGPRRLELAAIEPTGLLADGATHGFIRDVLAEPSRRKSVRDPLGTEEVGLLLALAGLVRLQTGASTENGTVTATEWRSWDRTREGNRWAEVYSSVDETNPLIAHAVGLANANGAGDCDTWANAVAAEAAHVEEMCDRAASLVDDGDAHGWSLQRFAEEITESSDGLDADASLMPLILGHLGRHLGLDVDARVASERASLLAAAGIGAAVLASTVGSIRLPGGGGAVGALLTAAAAHDVPILLQRSLLADAAGRPVAPPRSVGWVFAVQHESTLAASAELPIRTPVVLHGGSPAAVALLQHAARAGWKIAVCVDDDHAGRERLRWLLHRLGDAATGWGRDREEGEVLSESKHVDALLADMRNGMPT